MICTANERIAAAKETAAVIRTSWKDQPRAAIILGTGLGALADQIVIEREWNYRDLPHFVISTADGHRGRLLAGRLAGVPIVAMDGRFHSYEGHSIEQITFPIRVFSLLRASFLIVSNASGGLNPTYRSGDILLINDHVNLMGVATMPTITQSGSAHSSRYYDDRLLALSERIARTEAIPLRRGTYVAMLGPNYETRAEYRWLRTLGDVVGMSTVPEVLAASEVNLPVVAFSIVTNVFRPDDEQQTTSDDVIRAAASAEPSLRRIITKLLTSDILRST